jgi:hypothetical protein
MLFERPHGSEVNAAMDHVRGVIGRHRRSDHRAWRCQQMSAVFPGRVDGTIP